METKPFCCSSVEDSAQFPDPLVPEMRPAFIRVRNVTRDLADRVFRALAHGLGVEEDFFLNCQRELWKGNATSLRHSCY